MPASNTQNDYVNGLKLETKQGKYGEYIKGSIDTETIFNNPLNNGKWLNFMMFKSKGGKWYAKVNAPQGQTTIIDEKEIPFC